MWTSQNRARYDRSKLRYPSDLTDDEWGLVKPLIPPGKTGGGKRTVIMREVVNGLMYILSTGCQWRAIPKDLPPKSSVYGYFDLWTYDGTLERIHHALYEQCREREQREASPTAAIIDSQSVKSAEKGGPALIRTGTMRARRSRARSGTFLSTADTKDRNLRKRSQKFCRISTLKSSNVPIRSADLSCCQNAGSSSAPLPGSIAAAAWPRIGSASTEKRSRSCASPQSASCSENYAIRPEVSGRTLRGGGSCWRWSWRRITYSSG